MKRDLIRKVEKVDGFYTIIRESFDWTNLKGERYIKTYSDYSGERATYTKTVYNDGDTFIDWKLSEDEEINNNLKYYMGELCFKELVKDVK